MQRILLLLPLVACGGPEVEIRNLTAEIAVAPASISFGGVVAGTTAEQEIYVSNTGRKLLDVQMSITGPDAAMFSLPVAGASVEADEDAHAIPVSFTPETYLPYQATLVLDTNDEDDPHIEIPLDGEGIYAPSADICVNPLALDYGTVAAGSTSLQILYVENCGDAPLHLGVMDQTGSGAFRVDLSTDPTNYTIEGGQTQPVIVYYEPTTNDGDNGLLMFPSDDADEPLVTVAMIGNGGGTLAYPEAVIDCPPTAAPPQVVALDGSGSYDPGGFEPLTYSWTLVTKPPGSSAELTDFITPTTTVFADLGGDYEVQLRVTNTLGISSAPDRCFISAVPADDLHIELTWDTTNVDLDLHLLQNTTALIYDVPEDCNWCNPNPSWGGAGTDDDPRLDLDDRSDGPENINVLDPADGAYPVYVHYFDPLGGPATTATVKVFTFGNEVYSDSKVLNRNEVWKVGQVNWPAGTFGVYPDPLEAALRRQCTP